MSGDRKHRDPLLNARDPEKRKAIENRTGPRGLWCQQIEESVPRYDQAGGEVVYKGLNNAFLVFGRDRDGSAESGYGGQGMTQCGMIDLVAGRMSSFKNSSGEVGPQDKDIVVGPSFFADAARVYISQKCDIDHYFGLAQGSERISSKAKSGIGIKADHVRIVGREHIKIVTGKGKAEGFGLAGETNSGGGVMDTAGRIDLIAGNFAEETTANWLMSFLRKAAEALSLRKPVRTLQPISKGDNLIECLEAILDLLTELGSIVYANNKGIMEISAAVGAHSHPATSIAPVFSFPSPGLATSVIPTYFQAAEGFIAQAAFQYNVSAVALNHLKQRSPSYINSRHVYAN